MRRGGGEPGWAQGDPGDSSCCTAGEPCMQVMSIQHKQSVRFLGDVRGSPACGHDQMGQTAGFQHMQKYEALLGLGCCYCGLAEGKTGWPGGHIHC